MIGEEALARGRIVARRAVQRLDETRQRGERRAQLMAGIGDEIGAHLLDPPQRREIVERQQHQAGIGGHPRRRDRRDDHLVPAVERHALGELDALRGSARARAADRLQHFGHAQPERDRLARTQRRRHRGRARVERDDVAAAVERDHGIRQSGQHRFDQGVADARRARLVPGQRRRRDVAARACNQRRQRHQHETRECRQRGGGAEQPQAGERDRRGDQHQAHAPEALDPAADPDAIVNHCHVT